MQLDKLDGDYDLYPEPSDLQGAQNQARLLMTDFRTELSKKYLELKNSNPATREHNLRVFNGFTDALDKLARTGREDKQHLTEGLKMLPLDFQAKPRLANIVCKLASHLGVRLTTSIQGHSL